MEKNINLKIEKFYKYYFKVCFALFLKGYCNEKFCVFFDIISKSIYQLNKDKLKSKEEKTLIEELVRKLENLLTKLLSFLAHQSLLN